MNNININVFRRVSVASSIIKLLLICHGTAPACTIFCASGGDKVYVGNNEDSNYSYPASVWFVPAMQTADRSGRKHDMHSAHGRICFGWYGDAQGGMNDQGLFIDWAMTPSTGLRVRDHRLLEGNYVERVLANCADVDQAMAFTRRYGYDGNSAHFLIADRTGRSFVGEWRRGIGEFTPIPKTGSYQLITNFLLTDPELGGFPCSRFEAASRALSADPRPSFETCRRAIEAASTDYGQSGTKYTQVYNLTDRIVTLYVRRHYDHPITMSLDRELRAGRHEWLLDDLDHSAVRPAALPLMTAQPATQTLAASRGVWLLDRSALAVGRVPDGECLSGSGMCDIGWEKGPIQISWQTPGRCLMAVQTQGLGPIEIGFNGREGWSSVGAKLTVDDARIGPADAEFGRLAGWFDQPADHRQARYEGRIVRQGVTCDVVAAVDGAGQPSVWYLDATTHLPVSVDRDMLTQTGPAWAQADFGDYCKVGSLELPQRIEYRPEGLQLNMSIAWTFAGAKPLPVLGPPSLMQGYMQSGPAISFPPVVASRSAVADYAACAGIYRDLDGKLPGLTLYTVGNRLFCRPDTGPGLELRPSVDGRYVSREYLSSLRIEAGAPTRIRVEIPGLPGQYEFIRTQSGQPSTPMTAHVDGKRLAAICGLYHASPDVSFTLSREGGALFGRWSHSPLIDLYPVSSAELRSRTVDGRFVLLTDSRGHIAGLVYSQGGNSIVTHRDGFPLANAFALADRHASTMNPAAR